MLLETACREYKWFWLSVPIDRILGQMPYFSCFINGIFALWSQFVNILIDEDLFIFHGLAVWDHVSWIEIRGTDQCYSYRHLTWISKKHTGTIFKGCGSGSDLPDHYGTILGSRSDFTLRFVSGNESFSDPVTDPSDSSHDFWICSEIFSVKLSLTFRFKSSFFFVDNSVFFRLFFFLEAWS